MTLPLPHIRHGARFYLVQLCLTSHDPFHLLVIYSLFAGTIMARPAIPHNLMFFPFNLNPILEECPTDIQ